MRPLDVICRLIAAMLVGILGSTAFAQKPPQLGYVYPPAVPAGAVTDAQLGGFDFTPDMQWFVHDPLVKLTTSGVPGDYRLTPPPYWTGPRAGVSSLPLAREASARLDVDAAHPGGLVRWQVANANGASQTAVFYVSRIAEIVESRSRDLPQRLPRLPVGISGRLTRLTEVDRYAVVAQHDGLMSVELFARRLGSNFNAILQVRDANAFIVAAAADMQGLDGGLTFTARAGESYTVELFDAEFRGDTSFVYHLAVSDRPQVRHTVPARGRRGATQELEFIGPGLVTGALTIETLRDTVSFPADPDAQSHIHSLATPFGTVEVSVPLSDIEEQTRVAPSPLTAPVAVTNVFPIDTDDQRFSWPSAEGEHWEVTVESRDIGGQLDVALQVLDLSGNPVAENDDLPGTTDAGLTFKAAAAGIYTAVLRSPATRTGDANEIYRLSITRGLPDFSLTAPQQINLPLGGKTEIAVQATRRGGWDGEITLAAQGLPPGVSTAGEWKIPAGAAEAKIALQSAADAAVIAAVIEITGTAAVGETSVTRTAKAVAAGNLAPRAPHEQRIDKLLLAMTMPPPFEVRLIDRTRQRDVHRGATCLAEMDIVRQPGFTGEVRLEMAATQARYLCGSHGLPVVAPPDVSRVIYPVWMSEHLATDFTMRMATQGVAAVPDPHGTLRYLTQPADAQITMIMEGALLKLTSPTRDLSLPINGSATIPVNVARSAKLPATAVVELVVPDELAGLLVAEPLSLPPGLETGELRVTSINDARLTGDWNLTLKATARQEGKWPVISETELRLRMGAP